jgi:dienelactone hydrolase
MLAESVEFAKRGCVAVAVLRRGYGTSPGGWAESYGPCNSADYASAGRRGAADIKNAILFLEKRGDVEPAKVLAVGVSAGGFATVALTADPPPGLVAAISFAGGRGSSGPDTVCSSEALVEAFRQYGARSRTPMLWVYAQNDHFFGPALAQRLLAAFNGAGGQADFVHAPVFGDEGHFLFSGKGQAVWTPIVDGYLKTHDFALASLASSAAPALAPPRQISANGRKDFQTFLEAPGHKAFAVSESGAYAWRTARGTAEEAKETALHNCAQLGKKPCALYAVDDAYAGKGRN